MGGGAMKVADLLRLLKAAQERDGADYYLMLFPDGSGTVTYSVDNQEAFGFDRVEKLINWLEGA
jgi:hypothetical protein